MDQNYWAHVDLTQVPSIKTVVPGPRSQEMHSRAAKYMKGYSSQVRLFPVAFESGYGCVLTDVDGNTFTLSESLKDHEAALITIWATWCPPCYLEFPFLNEV